MRPNIVVLTAAAAAASALAQEVPPNERKMQMSIARQRAAVTKMADSIDRQKESVRRHAHQDSGTGETIGDAFFNLPAPPRTLAALDPPACDPLPATDVDQLVETAARREEVDPGLIRTVMHTESAYRPCAVSAQGAMGLMQLMPETAGDFALDDPFDPQANVAAGTKLLKELLRRYDGDLPLALSAYNAGPSKVDRVMSVPPIPETMNYVRKILSVYPANTPPDSAPARDPGSSEHANQATPDE